MIVDIFLTVRLKSSRLPRKALADVCGQTIIEHIIDRSFHVKRATNVVLCTSTNPEDAPLVDIAIKKGIPFFRGSENNIIKRFMGAAQLHNPDVLVRITGDNCLFSTEFIDYAIEKHIENKVDYTTTKELAGGSKGDIFSYSALKKLDEILIDENASEYLSWLLADGNYFKTQWLSVNENIKRPNYRLHCDTPEDLELVRTIYNKLYNGKDIVDYNQVIELLDRSPEIVAINSNIKQVSKDQAEKNINFNLKK